MAEKDITDSIVVNLAMGWKSGRFIIRNCLGMEPYLPVLSAPGFGVVGTALAPLYNVGTGAAYPKGFGEFALDAGDGGIEYGFGFCAKRFHFVLAKRRFIVEGLLCIEGTELFPVDGEVIGRDTLRMQ